jgi:type II secretory ATPase GspE/PulE/Tfp pilus assembly ATPase PilB-like protein
VLRQDPDKILIGEIRDGETASVAVEASLTGHTVFSTLHTNDAPSTVTRLIDMGVEPFMITATLEAVVAQRLLRTVCPDCKTSYVPEDGHPGRARRRRVASSRRAIPLRKRLRTLPPHRAIAVAPESSRS